MDKNFTITFTGKRAEELEKAFEGYFWDGGLDQIIEQGLLEEYNLSLDDVTGSNDNPIIDTDNAKQ